MSGSVSDAAVSPVSRGRVSAHVLGRFAVSVDGRDICRADWQRLAAERLVKLLLVTRGHRLTREQAAAVLWPDASPATSNSNLRKGLHFAGRALAGTGVLVADGRWIVLDQTRLDLDLARLEAALEQVARLAHLRSRDERDAAATRPPIEDERPSGTEAADGDPLTTVLELGALELLPDDADEDWLVGPRERLSSSWRRLALEAAQAARSAGRTIDAAELVARVIAADPADEAAHRLAIELYLAQGRRHAARRQYEACRQALRELLDAEPSSETVELARALERVGAPGEPDAPKGRLIGRRRAMERAEEALDRVGAGMAAVLLIRGPAGIGKTRVLEEVAAYARSSGSLVVDWQAVQPLVGHAFAPFRARLTQAFADGHAATLDEPARSGLAALSSGIEAGPIGFESRPALIQALVDACTQLARSRPLVLAWDDLTWLDASSIDVLRSIIAGPQRAPILIATTYRDDEPLADAAAVFIDEARRADAFEIQLEPLALRDIEALVVDHLGGESVATDLQRLVFDQADGNPLFCLELMRTGRDHGFVRLDRDRWSLVDGAREQQSPLPESVRRVVSLRSSRLRAITREMLGVAAELDAVVDFETLAMTVGREHLVDALDEALASGLFVERSTGYGFAHPLYRRAMQGRHRGRRGQVHLAIARALVAQLRAELAHAGAEELFAEGTDDPPGLRRLAEGAGDPSTVAEHALTAVELGSREAAPIALVFGFAAGERARRVFDHATAASYLRRALAIWERLPDAAAASFDASAAWLSLANARIAEGDDRAAAASFDAAIAAARDPAELAEAYISKAWVPYRRGQFDVSLAILREGRARTPAEGVIPRANLDREIGWCLLRLSRFDEAEPPLRSAVEALDGSTDRRGAMRALDALGCYHEMTGATSAALVELERSLALALDMRDARSELIARTHFGSALSTAGRPLEARPQLARARELGRMVGDVYIESVVCWIGAAVADVLQDWPAAAALRRDELALLGRIGGNPTNEALAHAHLAMLARRGNDAATFDQEAAEARRLAGLAHDPGHVERIECALRVDRWSDVPG